MLGTGDTLSYSIPQKLPLPKGICNIGGGCFQTLAVDSHGNIWTMGDNPSGQQGQGNFSRLYHPEIIKFENASTPKEGRLIDYLFWMTNIIPYLLFILSVLLNIYLYKKIKLTMAKKS